MIHAEPVPGALGYRRSSQGREIDFVVPSGSRAGDPARIPVEVKGDSAAELRNARLSIRRTFAHGIVTSRTVFDVDGDVLIVPIPVFLAALAALQESTERTMTYI